MVGTRYPSPIGSTQEHIDKFAQRRHAIYNGFLQLDPSGDWKGGYLALGDCDGVSNPQICEPSGAADPDEGVATEEEVNGIDGKRR